MIKLFGIKPALKELKGITRDVRVSWMLEELNLNYEFIVLDPKKGETQTPEYLKLNPTGKVPTLSDGEFSIFESSAICSYLAHKEKKLIPEQETQDYWIHQQWIAYVLTNIEPHTARIFGCDYFHEQNEKTAFARKLAVDILNRMLPPLEKALGLQKFVTGNDFLLVDLLFVTCLLYVHHTDLLKNYPNLTKYLQAAESRTAFKKAASRIC